MNTHTMIVICHIVFILHFADAKGNVLFDMDESNDITDNDVDDCAHGQDVSKSEAVPLIDFDVLRVRLPNHDTCAFIKCSVTDTKNKLLTLTITNTEVTDKGDDPANYDDVAIMDGVASVSRDLLRKKIIFNSPGGQVERQHISSDKAYLHIQTNNCSTNAFSCLLIYTDQTGGMRIQVSTKRVKNVAKCVNAEVSASQRDFHDFRQKLKTLQSEVTELPGRLESEINDVSEKVEANTQNTREWRDQVTQEFDDLKVNVAQNIDDFQQTEKVLKIQVTAFDDKVKLLEIQLSDNLKYLRKARRLNKVFREVNGLKRKVTELQKVVEDSKNGDCSAPNKICEKGEKGDQGEPGLGMPGMKGEKGERGLGGSGGTQSSKGEKGEPGIIGEPGLPGFPGRDGSIGRPGEKGFSGDPGLPGLPGPKGDRGFDGIQGFVGLKGEQGLPGNPGEKGEKGEHGPPGPDGLSGLDGQPGERGYDGIPGLTGRKGQKGERGETGQVGPIGPPVVLSETHTPNFDTEGPSGETCLDGWVYHDGSCYGFGTEAMSWANAQDVCNAFNAALVTIESEEENSFLKTLPSKHSENVFTIWIGATDIFTEGRWQWVSTQETIGPFTDWAPGEPNSDPNNGGEHCMSLIRDANWQWNDENCFGKGYFICEKQLKDQVKSLKVRRN